MTLSTHLKPLYPATGWFHSFNHQFTSPLNNLVTALHVILQPCGMLLCCHIQRKASNRPLQQNISSIVLGLSSPLFFFGWRSVINSKSRQLRQTVDHCLLHWNPVWWIVVLCSIHISNVCPRHGVTTVVHHLSTTQPAGPPPKTP